jgi:hypothetical protein
VDEPPARSIESKAEFRLDCRQLGSYVLVNSFMLPTSIECPGENELTNLPVAP